MQNIDTIRDELYTLLEQADTIKNQINDISYFVNSIEEANDKIIRLRNIIEKQNPIYQKLRNINELNSAYSNISGMFSDNKGTYESNLFEEINNSLNKAEAVFLEKTKAINIKKTLLTNVGEARIIPDNEKELIKFNKQIINQSTCPVCSGRVVNIRIDCGHLVCINCFVNIKQCPLCKIQISSFNKIYLKKYLKYRTKYMQLKNKI